MPHELQHPCGLAPAAGIHPKDPSENLGHAKHQQTVGLRTDVITYMQNEAAEQIGALLRWSRVHSG